jgi:hypothetical protein
MEGNSVGEKRKRTNHEEGRVADPTGGRDDLTRSPEDGFRRELSVEDSELDVPYRCRRVKSKGESHGEFSLVLLLLIETAFDREKERDGEKGRGGGGTTHAHRKGVLHEHPTGNLA